MHVFPSSQISFNGENIVNFLSVIALSFTRVAQFPVYDKNHADNFGKYFYLLSNEQN